MYPLSCANGYKYPGTEAPYVLDIISVGGGLAATASDQSLCLFDPLRLDQGPLKAIQTDHGALSSAKAYSAAESVVCTTGENGTVSLWDLRLRPTDARALHIAGGGPSFFSLACSSQANALAVGTELANHQASIIIWDLRSPSAPRIQYNEVHSDDVTELNFHPSAPHLLLSGSTDGLVSVCDTRIADEDEVLVQTFNHGSVHRAGFLNDTELYAVSHDEKFALYDMAEGVANGSATVDFGDVRQVVGCQYVAGVFPKLNGAGAVIGVGSQDQEMFQMIHLARQGAAWGLDRDSVVALPGAHGSELIRSFYFIDEEQLVLTAGEDSCIKAWRPGN
ncbi:WD40-repeat-containing domain protein [Lasiosphaeria miniovina]|uniref:WD40-repeat-containing domain protein n=1 Tax=Lasiosphaeria miniovina TaxID=1954250 RepID=A0AA40EB16_9PEZI|nr:WD40-repeat-containing domain protein [Lasiosphaeria miniovina]KAK0735004.1 WD40-repeat-containing domain protein [Lasiosphaeria miniovina]